MSEASPQVKASKLNFLIANYFLFGFIFTVAIALFSLVMASVAAYRNDLGIQNYEQTASIYNGPLEQNAPNLKNVGTDSYYYREYKLTPELVQKFIDNTFLTSTTGKVNIKAEFVKKGLVYQPTYRTEFSSKYVLKNTLDQASFVDFQFPLPVNTSSNEISNAVLKVNGETINDAKVKLNLSDQPKYYNTQTDGLASKIKIEPKSEVIVEVSYNTVGLSLFTYKGIENSKGSQDFNFEVNIQGTRSYNVNSGLSVDKREFGDNSVKLIWNKTSLYSQPHVSVNVGEKLNPSNQVSRVYMTMAPIYVVFISILLFLSYRFGKKLSIFDMFLVTILFGIYFPLIHYLSSFTIDPTVELFSGVTNIGEFSMPLYTAFILAWLLIGGLIYYLLGRISGFRFATRFGIPSLILFIGFFPLVVTIPEYSMLLVIIGAIALIAIILQVRISLMKKEAIEKV